MIPRKCHIGQRFVDAFLQGLGRRPQSHVHQLGYHLLGFFLGGFLVLLGLDDLENWASTRPVPRGTQARILRLIIKIQQAIPFGTHLAILNHPLFNLNSVFSQIPN
jgi:hypothetical protein